MHSCSFAQGLEPEGLRHEDADRGAKGCADAPKDHLLGSRELLRVFKNPHGTGCPFVKNPKSTIQTRRECTENYPGSSETAISAWV